MQKYEEASGEGEMERDIGKKTARSSRKRKRAPGQREIARQGAE